MFIKWIHCTVSVCSYDKGMLLVHRKPFPRRLFKLTHRSDWSSRTDTDVDDIPSHRCWSIIHQFYPTSSVMSIPNSKLFLFEYIFKQRCQLSQNALSTLKSD
jgi:hypothetical protein